MCGTSNESPMILMAVVDGHCKKSTGVVGKTEPASACPTLLSVTSTSRANVKSTAVAHFFRTSQQKEVARRKGDEYYCEKDMLKTIHTVCSLHAGCFYFPDLSSTEAKLMLRTSDVGTFIVRDSSDPKYLFTVSVKTVRGPTSIRIIYESGYFSLDSDEKSKRHIPKFNSVLDLLDFYMRQCQVNKPEQCRFVGPKGKKDLPIILLKPKLNGVPSLKHLCRTTVNRTLPTSSPVEIATAVDTLPLPKILISYMKDYPYLF